MAFRLRATSPVYCGRCGRPRGLTHICAGRRKGRTRVKSPHVSLITCSQCGKDYANPLTHVCPSRPGDYRRRKRAADRRRKAAEIKQHKAEAAARRNAGRDRQHRYEICRDEDCHRLACRAYKEGYRNGYEDGHQAGAPPRPPRDARRTSVRATRTAPRAGDRS